MAVFTIRRKEDGEIVYELSVDAEQPIELVAFPFLTYDYTRKADEVPTLIKKYGGRTELTHEEFRSLFTVEEQWGIDEFEAGFEHMDIDADTKRRIRSGLKSYYAATFVDLKNDKVELVLGVFAGLQLIAIERIWEILNG